MTLAPWLEPLPDGARMRATDAWAIEQLGIPSLDLMERAGQGLAQLVVDVAPEGSVAVVCGKGNNGGDGYVAARLLRDAGRDVRVLATAPVDELRGDARVNAERLGGAPPEPFEAAALEGAAVVVDALLGTGFEGAPRGVIAEAIAAIEALGAPVVAADVPSGVDATSGAIAGTAVTARATGTFHAAKPGLWIRPGKQRAGMVRVIDIGIPAAGCPVEPADIGRITGAVLELLPRRGAASTKFTSGHVTIAGGAAGMSGAVCLAALAALRAGAGYVTTCVPASVRPIVETHVLEAVKLGLAEEDGGLVPAGVADVLDVLERRGGALVLGCGLGRAIGAEVFARALAIEAPVPLVVDADGLNAHAGRLADFAERTAPTILTPHAGELGRLLDRPGSDVEGQRLANVREAAALSGAIVVLKGDDTLVAAPDGRVAVSEGGAPALATAGTGDVLAGVCGAFLAMGIDPFAATCAAVHTHVLAGRAAAEQQPGGVVASDVVRCLGARAR